MKEWLAALCLGLVAAVPVHAQSFTVKELVDANQNALNLIERIELTMEHKGQAFKRGKLFQTNPTTSYRWARDGARERNRYDLGMPAKDGRPTHIYDWYVDADSLWCLRNWDPKKPQAITPANQGMVSAEVSPRTRDSTGIDVPGWLLWTFLNPGGNEARTLRELVRESPAVELVGRSEIAGREVWQLRIQAPGDSGRPAPPCRFELFIEPATNFHVRRMVVYDKNELSVDGQIETVDFQCVRTVKRFRDFGDGVFVPAEVETTTTVATSDSRSTLTSTLVKDVTVNKPLPPEALDFRIPENVLVLDTRTGRTPNTQRVFLWGSDNKPAKEIMGPEDHPAFKHVYEAREKARAEAERGGTGGFPYLLAANLTALAVLLVLLGYRYYRRQPKHGS